MAAERPGAADGAGTADPAAGGDPLLAALPGLIRELAESAVVELEVSVGDARLYLRRRLGPPPAPVVRVPAAADARETEEAEAGLVAVTTPLAGVFYAAPEPDEPPYVRKGDEVEAGQIVGLVEAMKVFNEIHAEVGGVVARVLVASGQAVQAGQALLAIRPGAGAAGHGQAFPP